MLKALTIAAAGLALAGGTAAAGTSGTATTTAPILIPAVQPCVATISQPIVAGSANQEITVSVTEDLMDSLSVDVAPQSNLKVSSVTRDPGSKLVKMQVDATNGAPGTWALTLTGGNTSCKGQVKVSAHR
ncbi:MAG TPA: hypothetical protein VGI97_10265 [Gemmatimonadaceae bacterium]|jgi:hypothetical protein